RLSTQKTRSPWANSAKVWPLTATVRQPVARTSAAPATRTKFPTGEDFSDIGGSPRNGSDLGHRAPPQTSWDGRRVDTRPCSDWCPLLLIPLWSDFLTRNPNGLEHDVRFASRCRRVRQALAPTHRSEDWCVGASA